MTYLWAFPGENLTEGTQDKGVATFGLKAILDIAFYLTALLLAFLYLGQTVADNDLWGHVKFGGDFLKAGTILQQDPYSYLTFGTPWIDHEWLSEILFAIAYQQGNVVGITCLRLLLVSLICFLLLFLCRRNKLPLFFQALLLSFVLFQLYAGLSTLRPQLFTYLCFAVEIAVLQAATLDKEPKLLLLLPPLFLLWMNLHGGILAGLVVLFMWCGLHVLSQMKLNLLQSAPIADAELALQTPPIADGGSELQSAPIAEAGSQLQLAPIADAGSELQAASIAEAGSESLGKIDPRSSDGNRNSDTRAATETRSGILQWFQLNILYILVPVASVLATCVTPYGATMLPFLLTTATVPRPEIVEWHAIQLLASDGIFYLLSVVLALFISIKLMWRKEPVPMLVMLFCATLPLFARRHLPLAVLAIAILSLPSWAVLINAKWSDMQRRLAVFDKPILIIGVTLILLGISTGILSLVIPKLTRIVAAELMPVRAVSLLKVSGVRANLACFFDWGEYCIWHLSPKIKVSIDGRRETAYDNKAYQKNVDFINGHPERWHQLVSTEHTDLVLAHKASNGYRIMRNDPNVELIYEDELSALFAPFGSPYSAPIISAARLMSAPLNERLFP